MSEQESRLAARVGRLAAFLTSTDAVSIRIQRGDDEIEIARYSASARAAAPATTRAAASQPAVQRVDTIKADLVGVFRLSRPLPVEGEQLEEDRELAYIEALGIRNPVHSLGSGRIVAIASSDGAAVEYGQPLFLLDRG